jgi:hypothetical protein
MNIFSNFISVSHGLYNTNPVGMKKKRQKSLRSLYCSKIRFVHSFNVLHYEQKGFEACIEQFIPCKFCSVCVKYLNFNTDCADRSGRAVLACSNTRIVGSNPTHGMDVCVYSVFVCR